MKRKGLTQPGIEKKGDPVLCDPLDFFMKNRFGWKDKQVVDQTSHNINETYDEYRQRMQEIKLKAAIEHEPK